MVGTVLQGGSSMAPPKHPGLCSPPPVSIPCLCPSEEPMVRGRSVSGVRWAGGVRGIQHPRRRPEGQPEPFSLPLPPLPAAMLPDANKEEILIPQIAAFMRLGRRTGRRAQVRSGVRARPRARAPGCLPARSPHHLPCSAFLKCVRRAGVVGGRGRGRAWHLSPCHLPLPPSKETWCSLGRERGGRAPARRRALPARLGKGGRVCRSCRLSISGPGEPRNILATDSEPQPPVQSWTVTSGTPSAH